MILLLMFLAALNIVDRYYFCIYIAGALFLLTPNRKLRFNSSVAMLLLFGMAIILFNPTSQTTVLNMLKPFAFVLCYIMGFGLFQKRQNRELTLLEEEKRVSVVAYVLAAGTLLHFLLNMMINLGTTVRDEVLDFWTKSEMSATGQAALACLTVGVTIALLFSKVGLRKKLIAIAAIGLIVAYNLILAGRTLFLFIIITAAVAFLYLCIAQRRKSTKRVVVLVLAFLILVLVYNTNIFGVKTTVESSNFYLRFFGGQYTQGLGDDKRLEYKLAYIERFFDHMWGGGNIRKSFGHHAHDLYLDTYDDAGIFALLAIAVYIVSSLRRLWKCIRSKRISLQMRMLVLCTYVVSNMQFWLEPILRGIPWLLACYCFMDGAVSYLLLRAKETSTGVQIAVTNEGQKRMERTLCE